MRQLVLPWFQVHPSLLFQTGEMSDKENASKEKVLGGAGKKGRSHKQKPFGEMRHDGSLNSRWDFCDCSIFTNSCRVDMDKVGELEDMVRKNSEYQKLLQNKIKEMQNTEKQKEEEAVCREQKLIGKVRELEEQVKNQVSFSCEADPGAGSHVCFLVRRSSTL